MIRALLAVAAGIAVAWVGIVVITGLLQANYPLPSDLDATDREAFAAAIALTPVSVLSMVLVGWGLGTFAGAWLAARITGRSFYAMLVGGVMMLAGTQFVVANPHPLWFTVLGVFVFLPSAYVAGRIAAHS